MADQVERRVVLPAAPSEVWDALTEGDQLSAWFGGEVSLEPRFAGPVRVVEEGGRLLRGTVEEADPGHRLTFRLWDPDQVGSRVDFLIEPDGDGTRLTVTETRMQAQAHALAMA